jgi:hypothetical protein
LSDTRGSGRAELSHHGGGCFRVRRNMNAGNF